MNHEKNLYKPYNENPETDFFKLVKVRGVTNMVNIMVLHLPT